MVVSDDEHVGAYVHQVLSNTADVWLAKASIKQRLLKGRGRTTDLHEVVTKALDAEAVSPTIRNLAYAASQGLPFAIANISAGCTLEPPKKAAATHSLGMWSYVTQHWQHLVGGRLSGAQAGMTDTPLAQPPRGPEDLEYMRDQVSELVEPWERIGARSSPFIRELNIPSGPVAQLLYEAADLVEVLNMPVTEITAKVQEYQRNHQRHGHPGHHRHEEPSRHPLDAHKDAEGGPALTLLQTVQATTRVWLQSFMADMRPEKRQVGLDDTLHSWFDAEQLELAERVIASRSVAACRAQARAGCPASKRAALWATAMGLGDYMAQDDTLLMGLAEAVEEQALLTDGLYCADVARATNSEYYFLFQDGLRALLLSFSRDHQIATACAVAPQPKLAAVAEDEQLLSSYPPNGVVPFQGLASLPVPLFYLYSNPAAVYKLFRAMYCRYWCALHTLDAAEAPRPSLPALCRTFEQLMQEVDPELCRHLHESGCPPLELAAPWLTSAFVDSGLPVAQVLLLWDRVIGYDSLLPLAVLAAAVLTFRRDALLGTDAPEQMVALTEDLSQLMTVPLLQALLFDS